MHSCRYFSFLLDCTDTEFKQNSMSVFRVLKLMDQLRLDTTYYKQQLLKLLPRMDAHMVQRGPWQVESLPKTQT